MNHFLAKSKANKDKSTNPYCIHTINEIHFASDLMNIKQIQVYTLTNKRLRTICLITRNLKYVCPFDISFRRATNEYAGAEITEC